jgi:site-specific DNA-methyltransferase (adenine-specific)
MIDLNTRPFKLFLQADCMDVMRGIPDKMIDLSICDPPYFKGIEMDYFYHGGKSKFQSLAGMKKLEHWSLPDNKWYQELCRISKNQIIWGINYFNDFQGVPVGRIFWDKDNENSSFSDGEIASCSLIKSVKKFKYTWDGFRQGGNYKNKEFKIHKTQKPIALYKWLLQNYAKPGQIIFDSHVGSASSLIACEDMGF